MAIRKLGQLDLGTANFKPEFQTRISAMGATVNSFVSLHLSEGLHPKQEKGRENFLGLGNSKSGDSLLIPFPSGPSALPPKALSISSESKENIGDSVMGFNSDFSSPHLFAKMSKHGADTDP